MGISVEVTETKNVGGLKVTRKVKIDSGHATAEVLAQVATDTIEGWWRKGGDHDA